MTPPVILNGYGFLMGSYRFCAMECTSPTCYIEAVNLNVKIGEIHIKFLAQLIALNKSFKIFKIKKFSKFLNFDKCT